MLTIPDLRRADLDVERQPFWSAARELCRTYRIEPFSDSDGRVLLTGGGPSPLDGPSSSDDPRFVVVAQTVRRSAEVSFLPGVASSADADFNIDLFIDPKVKSLAVSYPVLTTATDERGGSLLPADSDRQTRWAANSPTHMKGLDATLTFRDDRSAKLAEVSGWIKVLAATKSERVELADIAAAVGAPRKVGPFTFQVTEAKLGAHEGSVTFTARYPAGFAESALYGGSHSVRVTDAAGERMSGDGSECGCADGTMTYQMAYTSGPAARGPFRLTWDAPVAVREHTVPFTFHDLPLK